MVADDATGKLLEEAVKEHGVLDRHARLGHRTGVQRRFVLERADQDLLNEAQAVGLINELVHNAGAENKAGVGGAGGTSAMAASPRANNSRNAHEIQEQILTQWQQVKSCAEQAHVGVGEVL